ncbi:GNAT family N-acetyltransferase [Paenibacillus sp. R14(2021)]|uniref:GNAT family N-acetyltransferase n=1 Tax=Paenibacillus sp. R14(2021) TaxID=2859228 RepID=UPI001C6131A8|nr:GNAT family N-acetyltransferase [Paenibacillus sp. R14(2021)]
MEASASLHAVRLVKPSVELQQAYLLFYTEWMASGEDIVPWVVSRDPADFAAYVSFLLGAEEEANTPEGWVPHTTLWLLDGNGRIAGAVNIRHRLNDKLRESGGHIGYGIVPSQRRQGYATALLEQALVETDKLDITDVLVVCDSGNIGSERTIRNNGGEFHSTFTEENGNVVKRFWIRRSEQA